MYLNHVPLIDAGMRGDPEVFARGVLFAICSIRQPVERVPDMLDDIGLYGEAAEALAMPMKFFGYRYLQEHATALWLDVCAMETRDALVRLLAVDTYFKHAYGRGRAQKFWDQWCIARAAENETTAEAVSALHLAIVN